MRYILITGARDYPDLQKATFITMEAFCKCGTVLVHGGARGIDREVSKAFDMHVRMSPLLLATGSQSIPFRAEWAKYGKAAGPIRNKEMVDYVVARQKEGNEVTCLAFPLEPRMPHSGTWDCIDRIREAGLELYIYGAKLTVAGLD